MQARSVVAYALAVLAVGQSATAQSNINDYAALRSLGEAAIRARLIDPSSAEFEWPYGFVEGTWPTILKNRTYEGFITCGYVNSKNRMGGYVGRTFFVVVVKDGAVSYSDIGTPRGSDFTSRSCARSVASFPAAPTASAAAPSTSASSVADELAKLAALRDRGVITLAEFEAQKRKLLGL